MTSETQNSRSAEQRSARMSKRHCIRMLLRSGPISTQEFVQVCGWSAMQVKKALDGLANDTQEIKKNKDGQWELV